MRQVGLRLLAVMATLTLSVALPSIARAEDVTSPKISDSLANVAKTKAQNEEVRVIILGHDPENDVPPGLELKVHHRLHIVDGVSATVKVKHLDKLAASSSVEGIALDSAVVPTGDPLSFPNLATLYPKVSDAPPAWNLGWSGAGVGIAVIDTGISAQPDFGNRLVQVQLPNSTVTADDTQGHGTFVAAIAAGRSPDGRFVGVAPGATVYGINVARPDGTLYTGDIIAGLDWVLQNAGKNNIRVVNVSMSETTPSSYLSSILDTAVERLWRAGITVVVSAGNRGSAAGAISYAPSNDPFAITVGALDPNGTTSYGDDFMAPFSSVGVTADGFAKPELLAPGRLVLSLLPAGTALAAQAPSANWVEPGYARISGSSFSSPQVAGAAAVLLEEHPDWTPDQLKWILTKKSRSVSGSGSLLGLDLGKAAAYTDPPKLANQGIVPTVFGLDPSTIAADPATASWNTASWNAASWNTASWNTASWNTASWNTASWNTASWNTASWNFDSWG